MVEVNPAGFSPPGMFCGIDYNEVPEITAPGGKIRDRNRSMD